MDRHSDSALCRSIQLCQDDSRNIRNLLKLPCLCKCILSGRTVQNNQRLPESLRIFAVQNSIDLSQLIHQILLIMESSGCIDQQHIRISRFCRGNRIVYDRGRVRTILSADDIHIRTLRPLDQLLSSRCTERICRR